MGEVAKRLFELPVAITLKITLMEVWGGLD